MFVGGIIFMVS